MADPASILGRFGIAVPQILLPAPHIDLARWAVVACDQFSSEPEYWHDVETFVGNAPSTLALIFPEAFLDSKPADKAARITAIRDNMKSYQKSGTLLSQGYGMNLVERSFGGNAHPRLGLVVSVDLEEYSFARGSRCLIRPTEATITERLPPRMEIRRGASLELPHIIVLVDDPGRTLIEPIFAQRSTLPQLYDFELMKGSGSLKAWSVRGEKIIGSLAHALEALAASPAATPVDDRLFFAVGDGNHSLATAKAVWEELKSTLPPDHQKTHPSRWALVELVNLYDEGLPFHPIHRLLAGASVSDLLKSITAHHIVTPAASAEAACAYVDSSSQQQRMALIDGGQSLLLEFPDEGNKLAATTATAFIEATLAHKRSATIDYIHGKESFLHLARMSGSAGVYLPSIDKSALFQIVARDGLMPRKTFSLGEATEKRFYMEARALL